MISTRGFVTETDGWPVFDLGFRYDERDDPSEVTVYDTGAEDITTSWITASVEDTVALDRLE